MTYVMDPDQAIDLGDPDALRMYDADHAPDDDFLTDDDIPEVPELDEESAKFVDDLVRRTIVFCEALCDVQLHPYQYGLAYRIVESLILGDADEITALWCRQSGKSETLTMVITSVAVLFPQLAKTFKILEKFKKGVWIGLFAPTDGQADIIYNRVADKLTSPHATAFLNDPEIDEKASVKSKLLKLKNGSFARRQTCNSRAKIEGSSYHICIIDEAQEADETMMDKSIAPMLASTAGTMVKIGTPSFVKGGFYKAIMSNKRLMAAGRRGQKENHFEYDYKTVEKYNPNYSKFIKKEKLRIGEDSDEFQMSFAVKWQLERGMLIADDDLDDLADKRMEIIKGWTSSACVAGIDVARVKDATVVTVCWVDWDNPDAAGYREHRVLNWLEINDTDWENQYFEIAEFLAPYKLAYVGVDKQGMGSPVVERLERMLGHRCEVIGVDSDLKNQSERWKHLIQLLQRRYVTYPGHSKARRMRVWKNFRQQMSDAEKVMKSQFMMVQAPEGNRNVHDDYVDSLAIACAMSLNDTVETVEESEAPWFPRR